MSNFIEDYWIKNKNLWADNLITRFPPEPNGLLHIGHAKSLSVNGGLAEKFGGRMNLRMDDTNPEKENEYFTRMIIEMVEWLGYDYGGEVRYASDYFPDMYLLAVKMIENGLAYVDFTPKDRMRDMRGTLTTAGVRSKDAENAIDWHLTEFERMRSGAYEDGFCTLRAKLDMASPNINLRDPVIYRIKKIEHIRTKDTWCIYANYDFAHPIEDWKEGISLSLCTLEFEAHRPFYDYIVSLCERFLGTKAKHVPVELEFARLELDRGLTSKRTINSLVEKGLVDGFDDPRLVTLVALRRRGFTPGSIRHFCNEIGVSKANSTIPFSRLEESLRFELDTNALRRVVVARPVLMTISNFESDFEVEAENHPKADLGTRPFYVSNEFWIDSDDIRSAGTAERGFKRIEPGAVFRIMHTGLIFECISVNTDSEGRITGVNTVIAMDKKPRVAVHGVSTKNAESIEVWEPLVIDSEDKNPAEYLIKYKAMCEPGLLELDSNFQAVRFGWLVKDLNNPERLIKTTGLKSSI